MQLEYIKANPSGNTTVFITSPVPRALYGALSEIVMKDEYLAAEQVGFVEKRENGWHMEMMAGEFCGNASRSFAAWLVMKGHEAALSADENSFSFNVDVSGAGLLRAFVRKTDDLRVYEASLEMPLPIQIIDGEDSAFGEYCVVIFEGIAHLILRDQEPRECVEEAKELLAAHKIPTESFGVMFCDTRRNFLTPLVAISEIGSVVWENSCGSGSAAVAAAAAAKAQKDLSIILNQPGGALEAEAFISDGKLTKIILSGTLAFTSEGRIYIPDGTLCKSK